MSDEFGPPIIAKNSSGLPFSDVFDIGADTCPGQSRIRKLDSPRGWDERAGYALSGATLVPKGDPLAVPVIEVQIWEGEQYAAWLVFAAKYLSEAVKYKPGTTTAQALSITHPLLNDPPFYITEVVVQNVSVTQPDDGIFVFAIEFKRYRKPIPALGKPPAALPFAQKPVPTAQDRTIDENTKKIAALRGLAPGVPQ
jgi:hypothetical protein